MKASLITKSESTRLSELERAIDKGKQTFVEVGLALAEIKRDKLYRASYPTFEEYCKDRWGWKRQRAYELINGATAVKSLPDECNACITNPRQATALSKAPASKRVEALETACERAESEGRPLTAAHIKTAVEELNETTGGDNEVNQANSADRPEPTPSACPRLPDLTQVKNDIAAAISDIEAFETGADDFTLDNCADVANALRDAAKALLKAHREAEAY